MDLKGASGGLRGLRELVHDRDGVDILADGEELLALGGIAVAGARRSAAAALSRSPAVTHIC
eukprot:5263194-Alexandrium_andersonii.AAC.1